MTEFKCWKKARAYQRGDERFTKGNKEILVKAYGRTPDGKDIFYSQLNDKSKIIFEEGFLNKNLARKKTYKYMKEHDKC